MRRPHPVRRRALSFLVVAVGAARAPAQVGETFVRATRSEDPATASRAFDVSISAEQLAATGERSLPRALGKAAGVWIQETNLGGGAPVVGGMLGNRILIVVDGVRLNDSTTRLGPNQSLNSIPPEVVERIDVIRGPGSVLYGSDAIGGAILIWTRARAPAAGDAAARDWRRELGLEFQSAAHGGRGHLGVSGASDGDGWLATVGGEDWGDLRSGGGEEFPTAYEGRNLFASWMSDLGDGRSLRVSALASRQVDVPRTDRLVTGFGQTQPANSVWDYALQDRQRYVLSYGDASSGGFADRMDLRLSVRTYAEERRIQKASSSNQTLERDDTATFGLGADFKKALGDAHLVTYGLDFDHDEVDSRAHVTNVTSGASTIAEGAFAPNAHYDAAGLFVQDEIFAFQPFDVTAGVRWSWFGFGFDNQPSNPAGGSESGSFQALTGSLAVARDVGRGARLTAVVAQGFRAPGLEDLANESSFFGGTELPNADLDPEQSFSAQLALDLTQATWSASLGLSHTWISDVVGRRLIDVGNPAQTGDETYLRDNVGRAHVLAADLAAETQIFGASSPWSLLARLSFALGRQFDKTIDPATGSAPFDDVPFRRIPPLFGRTGVAWTRAEPARGPALERAELSLAFAARQDELNPEDETDPRIDPDGTPGWTSLDLDLSGHLSSLGRGGDARWRLGLFNLLDESYRVHASGLDAPGFGVVLGLDLHF